MYNGVCLSDFVWEAPWDRLGTILLVYQGFVLILGEISINGLLLLFGLLIGYTLWLGHSCIMLSGLSGY